jgi:ubiquinone/menaquinone biosynthesis C-methylase UbiE
MGAMRDLLDGRGPPETFDIREVDALETDEAYAEWSETYDQPNPLIIAEERLTAGMLKDVPPGLAVDAATGTGHIAAELARLGNRVIAIDRSWAMLERAGARAPSAHRLLGDLTAMPIADKSVDLVTCSLALTHELDLEPPMHELGRIVRPGGRVITSDIHPLSVATGGHAFFKRADGTRAVARNFPHWPSEYVSASTKAGLRIRRCEEAFVDEALLREFAGNDLYLGPNSALNGLPFALLWEFERID